jgi:transposase InsO family protein
MEKQRDKLKLRRWCVRRIIDGWPITKVADHAQTPERTVYAWWNRFQWNGWVGLSDASRRPHTIHRLPTETVQKVLEVRRTHGWCSEAIEAYLKSHGIQVSHGSIYTILKTNQMINEPYKPRRQRTYKRWQRRRPDSLWQTDIKYYGNHYLIAFLDDCSRYLVGASLHRNATTTRILHTLKTCLSNGRTPRQILSDHGTQFYSNDGPSQFTAYLEARGIEHIMGSIGKPTTQGKIERFFRTFAAYYPRFNDLEIFRTYYNAKPHAGLNYMTPEQVYSQ